MTPFERALASGRDLVAAWDFEDNDSERLVLHAVGSDGAKELAETHVPAETREDFVDRLVARGVRIGTMYGGTPFTWVVDEQGFAVWTDTECVVTRTERVANVEQVRVWLGENRGHRGVRLDCSDGTLVISEERRASHLMITYGQDDLYYETFWAHYMGLHVALWHGVHLVNEITGETSIDDGLRVYAAARELASQIEMGGTRQVIVEKLGRAESLTLEAADDIVRVHAAVGSETLTKVIKRGTPAQQVAFLRRVTTPSVATWAMNRLINERS